MLRLTLSFICIVAFSFFSKAQEEQKKWSVSLSPALVFAPSFRPAIQPGLEYKIGNKLGILTELAFAVPKMGTDPSVSENKYFRVQSELKYIFSQKKPGKENYYVGLRLSYSHRKWKDQTGGAYFQKKDRYDSCYTYTSAAISSPVITSSLQLGYCVFLGEHFAIDLSGGMGIRGIITEYSNIENKVKDDYFRASCKIFPSPDPAWWIDGTLWRFHANLGLRFKYRF